MVIYIYTDREFLSTKELRTWVNWYKRDEISGWSMEGF